MPENRRNALAALQDNGFVVLPRLLSDVELAAARDHADDLLRGVDWSDNDFDGRRTRRVYSLLSRVGALEPLLLHPEVSSRVRTLSNGCGKSLTSVDQGPEGHDTVSPAGPQAVPVPGRTPRP